MSKKRLFTFKQLGFDNKPLDVSLPPVTETIQTEPPNIIRCRCWYFINKEQKKG